MEILFITDIADLEPLNLAHKGSSTEEGVLTPAFFFSGEQMTFEEMASVVRVSVFTL